MNKDTDGTRSLWTNEHKPIFCSQLEKDLDIDVCIIGGGIAGLTTAYLLCKKGRSVTVIEAYGLGSGQSGRTTAHFVTALDDRYFDLEKLHSTTGSRQAGQSHSAAVELAEKIIIDERIECEWKRIAGYLFLSPEHDRGFLVRELDAAKRAGLVGLELLDQVPNLSFNTGACILFPNQGQLQIIKYLAGLVGAIERMGGKIFTESPVDIIETTPNIKVLTANNCVIRAKSLVVATNSPINDLVATHTKQAPYRSYVIAAKIPKGSVPPVLLWDTGDPYHYIRTSPLSDLADSLVIGGEDHKTGQESHPEESFAAIEKWASERFPMIEKITDRWSGQVMEPVDSLGFMGRNPLDNENVFIITGDSGNGMTHTTIGAEIVSDLITKKENPWAKLYDPSRITIRAAKKFIKENANVACQYSDWFGSGDVKSSSEIKVGEGAIVRNGAQLEAVYRESTDVFCRRSAVCPHLGCIVKWNNLEKSWDCPCHGSRFDKCGRTIVGPAISDLKNTDVDSDL